MVHQPVLPPTLAQLLGPLREFRHDLHRHPELGFREHRTRGLVADHLEALGYEPQTFAETGVVVDLHPDRGDTIALRADMDALPMPEHTDLPYRSVHDGVAHKCGHDGHTAILLGVAAVLRANADRIARNVRLLFQPDEEGSRGGGARVMVSEGVVDDVAEIYGLHNWPAFPKGEVRVCSGAAMAQVDNFSLRIDGQGGHGGHPQDCRDPIVAGAHVVTALQSVVARGVGSRGPAVVTVGVFRSGTTTNVVPRTAELLGTIRTFDPAVREDLFERLEDTISATAKAHGCSASFEIHPEYPVLINDATCAAHVTAVATELFGESAVSKDGLPLAAAEDFAYFTQARPGCYFFLGAGAPDGDTPGCHHPDFDFDDDLLRDGVRMFVELVRARSGAVALDY